MRDMTSFFPQIKHSPVNTSVSLADLVKLSVLLLERWKRFLVGNVADRDGYGHVHLSSKRHVRHHLNVELEIDIALM